jgi:hypothetical protein
MIFNLTKAPNAIDVRARMTTDWLPVRKPAEAPKSAASNHRAGRTDSGMYGLLVSGHSFRGRWF